MPKQTGQVAYSRLTDGYWQIWVFDFAHDSQRQVTRSPTDKHTPTWSPDGTLVFRANGDSLYRVSAAGGRETPFLRELWPAQDPAFGPDGHWVAFARPRTDAHDVSAIWLAGPGGKTRRVLTRGPGVQVHPTWAPDGKTIAFEHSERDQGTELRQVSIDGTPGDVLVEASGGARNPKPVYSPDGRWLAYASSRSGDYEIWSLDLQSPEHAQAQLTHSAGIDTSPTWSPDSQLLAFTTQRRGRLEIWVMNHDGSDQRPLFEVDGPAGEPAWR